jgi:hypothetical protein
MSGREQRAQLAGQRARVEPVVAKARREDAVADRLAGGVASLQSCSPDESRVAFRIVAVAVTVEAEVGVAKTAEVSVLLPGLGAVIFIPALLGGA